MTNNAEAMAAAVAKLYLHLSETVDDNDPIWDLWGEIKKLSDEAQGV